MNRTHTQAELAEALGVDIEVIEAGDEAADTLTSLGT